MVAMMNRFAREADERRGMPRVSVGGFDAPGRGEPGPLEPVAPAEIVMFDEDDDEDEDEDFGDDEGDDDVADDDADLDDDEDFLDDEGDEELDDDGFEDDEEDDEDEEL
jgi:hypothetical protein